LNLEPFNWLTIFWTRLGVCIASLRQTNRTLFSLFLSLSCVWGVWVGLLCQFVSGAEFPLGSPLSSVVHVSAVGNHSAVFNQPSSTCYLRLTKTWVQRQIVAWAPVVWFGLQFTIPWCLCFVRILQLWTNPSLVDVSGDFLVNSPALWLTRGNNLVEFYPRVLRLSPFVSLDRYNKSQRQRALL